jgi:hypothetical protein
MLQTPVLTDRLAELVADLSGCGAAAAEAAVREAAGFDRPTDHDDRLAVVASALVAVRRARRARGRAAA